MVSFSCRPEQESYLYFMNFAASILEHDVETAEVFVSQDLSLNENVQLHLLS